VDLAYGAIEALLAERSRGAGVFLLGHSMGCVLAVQMAADRRGAGLLGLEIAGIGVRPNPAARPFMRALTEGPAVQGPASEGPRKRGGLRGVLWTPSRLYPDGAEAALALCASPRYEGGDMRALSDALGSLAARVRIPVRYTLGDHEGVWSNGPEALASFAALFTASPRVVTAEQSQAGHNLSLGRSALAYHLSVLAFAEECALIKECADRGNPDGG
jgi:pimeloyl-ACP methyl ester carboxylesterase